MEQGIHRTGRPLTPYPRGILRLAEGTLHGDPRTTAPTPDYLVLRLPWGRREDAIRPLRASQGTQGPVPIRRIIQGRFVPSNQGPIGPPNRPGQPPQNGGGKSVIRDIRVCERWLGCDRKVRGRNTPFPAPPCDNIQQFPARPKRPLRRQVGRPPPGQLYKDFVDPNKENTPPSPVFPTFDEQDFTDWNAILDSLYDSE